MLKEELFTTKEIQWFTLRLYKNNHNILKMDLYSLVPRERPRLKSYSAFLRNSKSGFSNPKYWCLFVLARLPAAVRETSPRSTERASGNRAYFLLGNEESDNISVFKLCFIGFYIYSHHDFHWFGFFRFIWGSKENLLLMEEMKKEYHRMLSVWVVEQVESYK